MKRILLLIAFAVLFAAGCQKDRIAAPADDGVTVNVSFTAALSGSAATRASSDGDGNGIWADRCKLQVLWKGKVFFEKTVGVVDLKAEFENIALIKDQTYDFLFWADNESGDYYDTDDLTDVKLKGNYIGCDDRRDAFSAAISDATIAAAFSKTVELYRPFAQLNVITTDIPALKTQSGTDDDRFDAAVPDSVWVSVTVPTVFNVKTGSTSVPKTLSYATDVYARPYRTASGDRNTLSMDYFLAPAEEGNVVEVGFSAGNRKSWLNDIGYTFSNVPLRRNYRTNILGAIIAAQDTICVEIKPEWSKDNAESYSAMASRYLLK